MKTISKELTRDINGGKVYRCKLCGYRSSNYAKAYANALWCVTKKFGPTVFRIANYLF